MNKYIIENVQEEGKEGAVKEIHLRLVSLTDVGVYLQIKNEDDMCINKGYWTNVLWLDQYGAGYLCNELPKDIGLIVDENNRGRLYLKENAND